MCCRFELNVCILMVVMALPSNCTCSRREYISPFIFRIKCSRKFILMYIYLFHCLHLVCKNQVLCESFFLRTIESMYSVFIRGHHGARLKGLSLNVKQRPVSEVKWRSLQSGAKEGLSRFVLLAWFCLLIRLLPNFVHVKTLKYHIF